VAQRSIAAFLMASAPLIDGIHEPDFWIGADSANGFFQMVPLPGGASTQHTVAYIGFDSANIYISVHLYQETAVLAKAMNRDVITKGDDGLAGWRFKPPFGAIYLIYSHDQEAELMGELARADALFLKSTLPLAAIR